MVVMMGAASEKEVWDVCPKKCSSHPKVCYACCSGAKKTSCSRGPRELSCAHFKAHRPNITLKKDGANYYPENVSARLTCTYPRRSYRGCKVHVGYLEAPQDDNCAPTFHSIMYHDTARTSSGTCSYEFNLKTISDMMSLGRMLACKFEKNGKTSLLAESGRVVNHCWYGDHKAQSSPSYCWLINKKDGHLHFQADHDAYRWWHEPQFFYKPSPCREKSVEYNRLHAAADELHPPARICCPPNGKHDSFCAYNSTREQSTQDSTWRSCSNCTVNELKDEFSKRDPNDNLRYQLAELRCNCSANILKTKGMPEGQNDVRKLIKMIADLDLDFAKAKKNFFLGPVSIDRLNQTTLCGFTAHGDEDEECQQPLRPSSFRHLASSPTRCHHELQTTRFLPKSALGRRIDCLFLYLTNSASTDAANQDLKEAVKEKGFQYYEASVVSETDHYAEDCDVRRYDSSDQGKSNSQYCWKVDPDSNFAYLRSIKPDGSHGGSKHKVRTNWSRSSWQPRPIFHRSYYLDNLARFDQTAQDRQAAQDTTVKLIVIPVLLLVSVLTVFITITVVDYRYEKAERDLDRAAEFGLVQHRLAPSVSEGTTDT